MKKFIFVLMFFSSLLCSKQSEGADVLTQCSTCNYSSDYKAVAKYVGLQEGKTRAEVFVLNPEDRVLKKYAIVHITTSEPGIRPMTHVIEQSLNSNELAIKSQLDSIFDNFASDSSGYVVPVNLANTSLDLIGSNRNQALVKNHYNNNMSLSTKINTYGSAALNLAGKLLNLKWVATIKFSDGSYANFQLTGLDHNSDFTLKLISVHDSEGVELPLNKNQLLTSGEIYVPIENFEDFQQAGSRVGVTTTIVGGAGGAGGSGGGPRWMICSANSSGGISCKAV
ncbi:hypothetical protein SOPP22_12175 [Shewanella sp. OPT22]|nr:hypothetical protein SOPP22_12175 [Shewanella sp. OPT22]